MRMFSLLGRTGHFFWLGAVGVGVLLSSCGQADRLNVEEEFEMARQAVTIHYCQTIGTSEFCDDFEDGNATANPTWTIREQAVASDFTVIADSGTFVYRQGNGSTSSTRRISSAGTGWANATVEGKLKVLNFNGSTSNWAGIYARYDTVAKTGYIFSLRGDGKVYIRKKTGSSNSGDCLNANWPTTSCGQTVSPAITANTWYSLKLVLNGNTLTGYVNGTKAIEVVDNNQPYLAAGAIAVGSTGGATFTVDDVTVNRAAGACENADGSLKPQGTICRPAAGACDAVEVCSGTSAACPQDIYSLQSQICRTSTGTCDPAELCTETSPDCPPDITNAPPATPTNVATSTANGKVTLTWPTVGGATGYIVRRGTSNSGPFTPIATITSPAYSDQAVTNGITYYYVLVATSECGESLATSPIAATPVPNFCENRVGSAFCDDFEDGESTNPSWSPRQNAQQGGYSVIRDGTYVYRQGVGTGANDARYISTAGAGWGDLSVEAKVKVLQFGPENDDSVGLFLRYGTSTDVGGYFLGLQRNNQFKIHKKNSTGNGTCVNATWPNQNCAQDYTITPGVWYTLKLQIIGNKLTAFINGEKVVEATDADYPGPGAIAVGSFGKSTFEVDDIVLAPGCMTDADCDDAEICTIESCQSGLCVVTSEPQGTSCGQNMRCGPDASCSQFSCTSDADCEDDENTCTLETCQNSVCATSFQPLGTSCGPDAVCNATGSCTMNTGFTYDPLGRLVAVAQNGTIKEGYGYDRAGNRCVVSNNPVVQIYNYCPGGEVNEQYHSFYWRDNTVDDITSYSDGDGSFTLMWPMLDGMERLTLYHFEPDKPETIVFDHPIGSIFPTQQGFIRLANGLHKFTLVAKLAEDASAAKPPYFQKFLRFDITVN